MWSDPSDDYYTHGKGWYRVLQSTPHILKDMECEVKLKSSSLFVPQGKSTARHKNMCELELNLTQSHSVEGPFTQTEPQDGL